MKKPRASKEGERPGGTPGQPGEEEGEEEDPPRSGGPPGGGAPCANRRSWLEGRATAGLLERFALDAGALTGELFLDVLLHPGFEALAGGRVARGELDAPDIRVRNLEVGSIGRHESDEGVARRGTAA